jgi:hypothetical protein
VPNIFLLCRLAGTTNNSALGIKAHSYPLHFAALAAHNNPLIKNKPPNVLDQYTSKMMLTSLSWLVAM